MTDGKTVEALERVVVRSGSITTRAMGEAYPEARGLTVNQYRVLVLVATSEDGLRVGEIARLGHATSQTATRLVQRLEVRGLLAVERGIPGDRRAAIARVTDLGARVWSDISTSRRAHIARALADLDLPADSATTLDAIAEAFGRYTG
jgi:DNA-binding MarR family transcriptional regulator